MKKFFLAASLLLLCANTASAQWVSGVPWSSKRGDPGGQPQLTMLENYINETCAPDDIHDVFGFISQGSQGGAVDINVFCRKGHGRFGKVRVSSIRWESNPETANLINQLRAFAFLGYYYGNQTSSIYLAGPATDNR